MNLLNCVKCLFCLIKCSKYLYFVKKAICFFALVIGGLMLLSFAKGDSKALKKIKEMF